MAVPDMRHPIEIFWHAKGTVQHLQRIRISGKHLLRDRSECFRHRASLDVGSRLIDQIGRARDGRLWLLTEILRRKPVRQPVESCASSIHKLSVRGVSDRRTDNTLQGHCKGRFGNYSALHADRRRRGRHDLAVHEMHDKLDLWLRVFARSRRVMSTRDDA